MSIRIKRIYEKPSKTDGSRFLIDRLWPRGVKRESLLIKEWIKQVAPSDTLRHWFHQEPSMWEEFKRRYAAELDSKPETWQPLVKAARSTTITLLFSSRNLQNNNAEALRIYLENQISIGQDK